MQRIRGFTLIELVVVVVIIAILAAIAYPMYIRYIEKARRSAAITALQRAAAAQEKYYATRNAYASSLTALGYPGASVAVPNDNEEWYALSVTSASGSTYTITAVPQGVQAKDDCGTYKLASTGARTVSGTVSTTKCWGSG